MNILKRYAILPAALLATMLYSCNNMTSNTDSEYTEGISAQDSSFAANAAVINMAEIQMGEMAVNKVTDDSTRRFAETMITEHTSAMDKLKDIASGKDLQLPSAIDAKHKATADSLSGLTGVAFDSAYIKSQVIGHGEAELVFQQQVEKGQDPELKDYASKTLEHIRHHLERAENIRDTLMTETETM